MNELYKINISEKDKKILKEYIESIKKVNNK